MKKILFIIWSYSFGGGAEALLTTIVNNLNQKKYELGIIEVFHSSIKKEPANQNVKIYTPITFEGDSECKKKSYYIYNDPDKIIRKYIPSDYDLYVSFNYQMPSFLLPRGKKNIAWIHGDIYDLSGTLNIHYRNLQAAAFKKVKKIISISTLTTKSLIDLFPAYSDKVVEIFNGIDINKVQKLATQKMGIKLSGYSILFVGRMEDGKNPLRMLEIFKGVQEKNSLAHLYFLGKGELESLVQEKAETYGLQNCVHFLGYLENPFPVIKQADVCCMTSKSEGFPMSLLESVALGVPFVSTRVGGADILTNEGRCGSIYETDKEAVDSIIKLFKTPKEHLAAECEKSICRFNLAKYISKIEKLFDEVLDSEDISREITTWDMTETADKLEDRNYYYRFPDGLIEKNRKIILYGAGDVGTDYYNYIKETGYWHLAAWIDAKADKYRNLGLDVKDVDAIGYMEYDVILIAVMDQKTSDEIRINLCMRNIPDCRILWVSPIF